MNLCQPLDMAIPMGATGAMEPRPAARGRGLIAWIAPDLALVFALITLLACGVCAGKDTCFDCHVRMEGMSLKYTNDFHYSKSLSCANCHGGDANEPDQNISMNASRGFKVRVTRQGVPEFCARCHTNTVFMSQYETNPPVDQFAQYQTSVHGKLLAAGRKRVAECVDCHSVHDTRAVADPLSSVSWIHLSKTCAKCHAAVVVAFTGSPHDRAFFSRGKPGCTVCHSAHATEPTTTAMLTGANSVCYWQADAGGVILWLDVSNGGGGVELVTGRSKYRNPPRARMTARSITLRSSRTFPGQS